MTVEKNSRLLPLQNACGRDGMSLNGSWSTIIDPYDNGLVDYRFRPHTVEGYFSNLKPQDKTGRIEYDFDRSETLHVPGDWNSQRRELFLYEGTVWYKRELPSKPSEEHRVFLHFGAANYEARVYVNGQFVAVHEGGFTSFSVEITGLLQASGNFLVVMVNNRRRAEGVPALNTDWWNYGGLTRDVRWVETPQTFIDDYCLRLEDAHAKRIGGWVKLNPPQPNIPISIRMPELGVTVNAMTDGAGTATFVFEAPVELWTPESPRLYSVEVATDVDSVFDRVGFRTIAVRGQDILLNGQSIFLRGISIHEQAPLREGRANTEADALMLLGWAKELGANFVRLAHYPHQEATLRAADELGLLVWSEIPVYWTIDWDNPKTLANAKSQLVEMIERDRNRASVILWSVGNETPTSEARFRFMVDLINTARKRDPTRLVTAALERHELGAQTQLIDDPLGQHLDVLGCNEYLGWYDGLPNRPDGVTWQTTYDKPLIISEFGADALQGHHGDALTRWTEEYQASVYEHQIAMLEKIPFLRGITPWILMDFRSPRRPLPGIQDFWNRKGLVSERGDKKQAFSILQQFYERLAKKPA
jgi:beta-glucuronidase